MLFSFLYNDEDILFIYVMPRVPSLRILQKYISMFTVSLFFLSLILTSFIPAYGAATLTYDNASGDGVWTNTENWTTGILPTGDDDVIITDDVDSNGGDTPTIRTLSV